MYDSIVNACKKPKSSLCTKQDEMKVRNFKEETEGKAKALVVLNKVEQRERGASYSFFSNFFSTVKVAVLILAI